MEGLRDGGAAGEGRGRGKKRKNPKYLSSNNVKRKSDYGLRSGTQGFLVTCDKGKERATMKEVINLLDEFYERLVEEGNALSASQPFQSRPIVNGSYLSTSETSLDFTSLDEATNLGQMDHLDHSGAKENEGEKANERAGSCSIDNNNGDENVGVVTEHAKNIDDALEAELSHLRDRKKARFTGYNTGCAGIVFVEMLRDTKFRPLELVLSVVQTISSSKQSRTRFTLRLLPVEVTCYASGSEVKRAAEPVILQYFQTKDDNKGLKYAVVYEARANTSLDRMEIIKAVAELVPKPHSVDLKNPDITIVVQVLKTTCALGIARNFKEMAKYNLKQLVLPKTET